MNHRATDITIAIEYHERTEHELPDRFAASLGYLDWKTQPDPFRVYHGAERIELPLCEPAHDSSPSWGATRSGGPVVSAPLDIKALSQLLFDSQAISAWKKAGNSTWALRCNPSSGNLHPTEAYLLVGAIPGLTSKPALLHYSPRYHAVEVLRWLEPSHFADFCAQLPRGAIVLGLSSIIWREAWKYGERAFRYCMHDVGHAMQAIAFAARMLGWRVRRIEGLTADQLDLLLALNASTGPEAEHADVLLAIEPLPAAAPPGPVRLTLPDPLLSGLCPPSLGSPNTLSTKHEVWPVLSEVEKATRETGSPHGDIDVERIKSAAEPQAPSTSPSPSARVLARQRRSAVDFDGKSGMSREQLYQMLSALVPTLTPSLWTAFLHRPRVHPVVFLHRIAGLEPGLAILIRNRADEPALRMAISRAEKWERLPGCPEELPLYRLMACDLGQVARAIHCHQNIAAEGALVTSMIGSFDAELERFGASAWRYLHWEAGAVGQLLYLEAEALKLSATGIGCFFDRAVSKLLGLSDDQFRMLYGVALGRAVHDPRIQTLPAYQR